MSGGIDIKLQTIGQKEIVEQLKGKGSAVRRHLAGELESIGRDVAELARSWAPKDTGKLSRSVKSRMGKFQKGAGWVDDGDRLTLQVRPYSPIAHLVERGRPAGKYMVSSYTRHVKSRDVRALAWNERKKKLTRQKFKGVTLVTAHYREKFMRPKPFFIPAVQAAGDVSQRLQSAIDRAVAGPARGSSLSWMDE